MFNNSTVTSGRRAQPIWALPKTATARVSVSKPPSILRTGTYVEVTKEKLRRRYGN
ncbi:hypothetical protein I0P70_10590 [Pontibacter sp. FD36]|uniref:hypothetical protein n=1 Tax=Pontibacter sp. FD36 TaxID=2789860 RepID=UPI0018A88D7E|nr:hypothetical protein [Pontibacter sp. FD36]MBF8963696.1 hypothetical protein [Pontibacter sp. FD36]